MQIRLNIKNTNLLVHPKAAPLTGIGLLGSGVVIYGGYSIWDHIHPKGITKLSKDGYEFRPPTFTNHENLDHGCSETIFKEDPGFEQGKLYGCGIARMDLWDSGDQFTSQRKTVNYLSFNSEIALRKGNKGWKINTRFDNHSDTNVLYEHYITVYEKEQNKDWKKKESFFIVVPAGDYVTTTQVQFNNPKQNNNTYSLYLGTKDLHIKVPNKEDYWYKNKDYFLFFMKSDASNSTQTRDGLKDKLKETKKWSGIWVEGSDGNSWIFKDMEIFVENKKHSRVFCKEDKTKGKSESCWEKESDSLDANIYKEGPNDIGQKGTWRYTSNRYDTKEDSNDTNSKVKPIIEEIKGSKGKWIDMNEICSFGHKRDITEEQLKNVRLFCSSKKKITNSN